MGQPRDKGGVIAPKSGTKSNIDEFLEAAAKLPAAPKGTAKGAKKTPAKEGQKP